MIRKLTRNDREIYKSLAHEFYQSDAVLSSVPDEYFDRTFDEIMQSTRYAEAFLLCRGGDAVGYALLAKTFSQEAGGNVVWIEELYVRPEHRGAGLGSEFFRFLFKECPAARYRLEIEPENEAAVSLYKRMGFEILPYGQMKKDVLL